MSPKRRKAAGRKPAKRKPAKRKTAKRKAVRTRAAKRPARRSATARKAPARRSATSQRRPVKASPPFEMMAGAAPESVALEAVVERASYQVQRGAHIFATANVDAAQSGEVSLSIDQTRLGTFTAPVASRDLGLADDIIGKLLIVDAIVSDVMRQTNALRIRVTLTGGPSPKTVPASADTDESGGSAHFRIFVLMKE